MVKPDVMMGWRRRPSRGQCMQKTGKEGGYTAQESGRLVRERQQQIESLKLIVN